MNSITSLSRGHTVSSTPCNGAWTSTPLNTHLSMFPGMHVISNRDSHLHPPHNNSSIHMTTTTTDVRWCGRVTNGMEWFRNSTRLRTFIQDIGTHPPGMTLPRTVWVRLNQLCTGVGCLRSCLHNWGMAPSAACERGAEEQTVDHFGLYFALVHGVHAQTVLDVQTTEWLLNTWPEICRLAVD